MDVDDLLGPARLPDVAVDTDDALGRTLSRGRASRRRRRMAAAAGAVVAVAGLAVTAVALTGDDPNQVETVPHTTSAPTSGGPTTGPVDPGGVLTEPEPGDEATWTVDPADPPSPEASTFTARVMRVGCHGGETGEVLRPGVVVTDTEVTVTFTVERFEGVATCPGNDEVPYEVDLGEPLGDRALVDGTCTAGSAQGTAMCAEDGGVRWPAPAGGTEPTG